ncbi:protein of unknown function (plasmid) [Cupriavidus taiwanensis]|nr:protein of unknown function [Cupriavidus taiwanensis]
MISSGRPAPACQITPNDLKVLDDAMVGIEMADAYPTSKPATGRNNAPAGKVIVKKATRSAVSTIRKPPADAKTAEENKSVTKKLPVSHLLVHVNQYLATLLPVKQRWRTRLQPKRDCNEEARQYSISERHIPLKPDFLA